MPSSNYGDLDNHLRNWGLRVVEVDGWKSRSANWYKSFNPKAVTAHHTAFRNSGNAPSVPYITSGSNISPLSQLVLGRDGTVYIICADRANHAGVGGPWRNIPRNSANSYAWGIEAENDGRGEKWSSKQLNAYYRLTAALMAYNDIDIHNVFAHKEWAPDRKIDPAGIDMASFRYRVRAAYNVGPTAWDGRSYPGDSVFKIGNRHPAITLMGKHLVKHLGPEIYSDHGVGPGPIMMDIDSAAIAMAQKRFGMQATGRVSAKFWKRLLGARVEEPVVVEPVIVEEDKLTVQEVINADNTPRPVYSPGLRKLLGDTDQEFSNRHLLEIAVTHALEANRKVDIIAKNTGIDVKDVVDPEEVLAEEGSE